MNLLLGDFGLSCLDGDDTWKEPEDNGAPRQYREYIKSVDDSQSLLDYSSPVVHALSRCGHDDVFRPRTDGKHQVWKRGGPIGSYCEGIDLFLHMSIDIAENRLFRHRKSGVL